MILVACEVQGTMGTARIERPDSINKLKPGYLYVRYDKFDADVITREDDVVVAGQKICLRIGYHHPDDPDALGVLINTMREP
jgi:hypothetical protein